MKTQWWNRSVFMAPEDEGGGGGGSAPPAPSPSPAPAPAPNPAPSPAPAPAPPAPSQSPAPAPAPAHVAEPEWRERIVGKLPDGAGPDAVKDHEARLKLAQRFNSEADILRELRKVQVKFSSGQVKTKKPDAATPEQLVAWRAENGIPETPDKYDLKLDAGMVVSAEDKALLAPILTAMHAADAPPEAVSAGVKAYFSMREEEIAAMVAENDRVSKETKVQLTEEWGARDFQSNTDGISLMLEQAGKEVVEALENATGLDGVKILNNPSVMRWLAKNAREGGYVGATPTNGDFGAAAQGERERLQALMVSDPDKYYGDPKNAERLGGIIAAQARRGGK